MDDLFVRASGHSIVSVDEMVPSDYFYDAEVSRRVFWERNCTQAVVHEPGGAHPSSSDPLYGFDIKHFKQYGELLSDGGYSAWAEAFLGDSESSYQSAVGGLEAIQSLPLPVY
jgi:glutaconate CoA-transferase subunit A